MITMTDIEGKKWMWAKHLDAVGLPKSEIIKRAQEEIKKNFRVPERFESSDGYFYWGGSTGSSFWRHPIGQPQNNTTVVSREDYNTAATNYYTEALEDKQFEVVTMFKHVPQEAVCITVGAGQFQFAFWAIPE